MLRKNKEKEWDPCHISLASGVLQKWHWVPNGFLFPRSCLLLQLGRAQVVLLALLRAGTHRCKVVGQLSWIPPSGSFLRLPLGIWRLSKCSWRAEEIHLEVGKLEPAPGVSNV